MWQWVEFGSPGQITRTGWCTEAGDDCREDMLPVPILSWKYERKKNPMLDELMMIPWYELSHAYGSAEEVPIWLRQLTSNEQRVREDAMSHLYNSILHQGSIYPSTPYAVSFLLELLQEPTVQGKADILELLAAIVISGYPQQIVEIIEEWTWIFGISSRVPFKDPSLEISKGLPIYVALLGEVHSKEARLGAANLIMLLATRTTTLSVDQREHLVTHLQPLSSLLEEKVVQEKGRKAMTLVETLLFLWFPCEEQTISWTQIELTKQQEHVLTLFYDRSDIWKEYQHTYSFPDVLQAYELPESQEDMANYLKHELSPPIPQPQRPQTTNCVRRRNTWAIRDIWKQQFSSMYPDIFFSRCGGENFLSAEVNSFEAHIYSADFESDIFFHLPDSPTAMWEMKREYQLLCLLQERVSLPVPRPLYVNLETDELGRIFMGYRWFPGRPLYKETWECLECVEGEQTIKTLAHQVASFLSTLHHLPLTDLAAVALPVIHQRTSYENLFTRVRLDLFPHLPKDRCEQIAASFNTFLDTPQNFTLTPVLVHGTFSSQRILFDGERCAISGVVGFTHAGLGDPAYDIAPLFGPQGYGKKFRQFFEEAYPNLSVLRERIQFYVNATLLQEAFSRYDQQHMKDIAHEFTFYRLE